MKVLRSKKFIQSLQKIIEYISKDSKKRALNFKSGIDNSINDLVNMPFKFRQSIYFQDESIRDLIFKGYTIVYRVDESLQTITIIGIKKCQDEV